MRETDPSWNQYPETLLDFDNGAVTIDLRRSISAAEVQALAKLGLRAHFAVITAENPQGTPIEARANAERTAALIRRVQEAGHVMVAAQGCSPDRRHCEQGVALTIDLPSARELAREFDQTAFFWFDGASFWIVDSAGVTAPTELPAR